MSQGIEQVNQDMLLHSNYLNPSLSVLSDGGSLLNPARLISTLRQRNLQYEKSLPPTPASIPEPLRQLSQRVQHTVAHRTQTLQHSLRSEQQTREFKQELPWEQFTLANQEEYADAHQEYLIHKMVAQSSRGRPDLQKSIKDRMMAALRGFKDGGEIAMSRVRSMEKAQDSGDGNRGIYMEWVKRRVLGNEEDTEGLEEFGMLAGGVGQLWQILIEQIRSFEYATKSDKRNPNVEVVLASLNLIEQQFRKQLPGLTSEREISEFMRKKYVAGSKQLNYLVNQDGILVWAVPYAFYRAGIWPSCAVSLNDRGRPGLLLKQQFSSFNESLALLKPAPQFFREDNINDIFYNQMVQIVKGASLYEQRLSQIGTLDLVWLALKTLKIYSFDQPHNKTSQFEQIVASILDYFNNHREHHKRHSQSLKPYIQFMYLGAYRALIQYRNSAPRMGLTNQDFLHLLLVLNLHPELAQPQSQQSIGAALEHELTLHINALIRSPANRQYTIYYLLLVPPQRFKNVITTVFATWEIFQEIDKFTIDGERGWKYLKFRYDFLLHSSLFDDAIMTLLRSLAQREQDPHNQISIVQAAQQLLSKQEDFVEFVIMCQCNHLLKIKEKEESTDTSLARENYQQSNLTKDERVYRNLNSMLQQVLQGSRHLQSEFAPTVGFLAKYCDLEDLRRQKNLAKLEAFLRQDEYVRELPMLLSQQQSPIRQLAQELAKNGAIKLFVVYLKNVIHARERASNLRGTFDKLKDYKDSILKTLSKVAKQTPYKFQQYLPYLQM